MLKGQDKGQEGGDGKRLLGRGKLGSLDIILAILFTHKKLQYGKGHTNNIADYRNSVWETPFSRQRKQKVEKSYFSLTRHRPTSKYEYDTHF